MGELNWLGAPPTEGDAVSVQIRYRAPAVAARVTEIGAELALTFNAPQKSVTPGQSAVVFRDDRLLGGGRIGAQVAAVAV